MHFVADVNEVMVSVVRIFGSFNAESQSTGLDACILSSSPAHGHFSGPCLPLGAPSGRGGRGSVRPHGGAHALCAFPGQQGTEAGLSLIPMLAAWKQITTTSLVLTDIARGHVIIF